MSGNEDIQSESIFTDLINLKGLDAARQLYGKPHIKNQLQTYDIHKVRAFLPTLLKHYNAQLERTNPAIFKFLSPSQREALKSRLKQTWYLLYSQYQLDDAEDRHQALAPLVGNMIRCNKLLGELELAESVTTPQGQLDASLNDSEKYLKYIGLTTIAPILAQQTMDLVDGVPLNQTTAFTGFTIDLISKGNGLRLFHWVWGAGMVSASLDLLPDDFYYKNDAATTLGVGGLVMGFTSWFIYYVRFGFHLGLLLKHSIDGPWMNKEESKIPAWERFTTQWQQRKFALLNDSIWATSNLSCYYWLIGPLTPAANILTAILLLMDLSLTIWRFWEESTEHNNNMLHMENAQIELKKELATTKSQLQTIEEDLAKKRKKMEALPSNELKYAELAIAIVNLENSQKELLQKKEDLEHKIAENKKLIASTEFEWKYKKNSNINDLVYAGGLLVAFSLMCCFFCPPALIAQSTLTIIAVSGAALCFLLTLVSISVGNKFETNKIQESKAHSRIECEALLQQFKTTSDENTKKMLYLEMKGIMAESEYQQRMVRFQKNKLVQSILFSLLLPALNFSALVFLPLGIGFGVVAEGIVLMVLAKLFLDGPEPKANGLPCFDAKVEREYNEFKDNPEADLSHFEKKPANILGFFPPERKQPLADSKANINIDDDLGAGLLAAN